MKKKPLIFLACTLTALTLYGCGASVPSGPLESSAPDQTAPTETASIISISGNNMTLGNLEFMIPDGFTATVVNESSVALVSSDKACSIGLFATDISALDEAKAKEYLPLQHNSFVSDDCERVRESSSESLAAGFDITMNSYGKILPDASTACMDSTFTDSWYAYTILFECDINSPQIKEYITSFAEFTGYANYVGAEPRFDFVQ